MKRWYVYHLVDPRCGEVFYVGKGTGSRVRDHEVEARRGVTSEKCKRIREIWNAKLPVERRIVRLFGSSAAAFAFEASEIERIGVALTNVMGFGLSKCRRPHRPNEGQVARMAWLIVATRGAKKELCAVFPFVSGDGWDDARQQFWRMLADFGWSRFVLCTLGMWSHHFGHEYVAKRLKAYGIHFEPCAA
jgi:hypothetical protein